MKTSTEICSAARKIGEERAVELIAKSGFDAWDFSMFDMVRFDWTAQRTLPTDHPLAQPDSLAFARKLKRIGLDNGIRCNQSHAPFPCHIPEIHDCLKRAIECTAEAGGEICVIHPINDASAQRNAELYAELLPFAKEHHVKIATENMWIWDDALDQSSPAACSDPTDFNAHLDAVNDPFFVACLDIGHAEMRGVNTSAEEMILALGDRLQALHVHDNDGWHDSHQIPFSMTIDFEKMVRALKKIGYQGYMTLEADAYLREYAPEDVPAGIQRMADAARRLADMFDRL